MLLLLDPWITSFHHYPDLKEPKYDPPASPLR
jgi:hypothetical protein